MPTRQYVGARYVPKFATPIGWDNTRSYEALEIVTHLGTSYTSKKAVPAGVEISNSEYWVATGNYNAQVEQYRQDVARVQSDLNGLEDDLRLLDRPHYVLLGDSYAIDRVGNVGWASYLKSYMSLTDSNCWDATAGSRGFIGVTGQGVDNSWLAYLQSHEPPAGFDNDKVSKIIIVGGYNDRGKTQTELTTAMGYLDQYIKTTFPNAEVLLFMTGCDLSVGANQSALWTVYQAYVLGCKIVGWNYCSGLESVYHNTRLIDTTDYHHPNSSGNATAAEVIKTKVMTGGNLELQERGAITPYSGDDYVVSGATSISFYSKPDGLDCTGYFVDNTMLEFSVAQSFGSNVKIGTISGSFYKTFSPRGGSSVFAAVKSDDTEVMIPMTLLINESGEVFLRRSGAYGSGSYKKILLPSGRIFKHCTFLG